jgi:phosphoribosyl 1,2-cyclic phosphodiesterase
VKVKFWGVRGSIPVPGPDTVLSGGNTPCVEIQSADREVLILDAGTGIRLLGLDLDRRPMDRLVAVLLFSHTHWDHIQGLPFFSPARLRRNRLVILGGRRVGRQLEQVLAGQMTDAYLPFTLEDLEADLLIKEVRDGERIVVGNSISVLPCRLTHPGGVFGYRIRCQDQVVIYATDVNHPLDGLDSRIVELARDADLLIHDAQYTPQEKSERPDWGHSSWEEAVQTALQAGVRRLALFHHDPMHTDADLDELERKAQTMFAGAFLAREGMEITI